MPVLLECLYCEMSWPIVRAAVGRGVGWDRALPEGLCACFPKPLLDFSSPCLPPSSPQQ